jgi:hypothetical protein
MQISHGCNEKSSLEATRGRHSKSLALHNTTEPFRSIAMLITPFHLSNRGCLVGLAFVLAASNSLASELDRAGPNLRLTIVPEYYVVGNARFNNVASVETWLLFKRSRVGAIDRCESTTEPRLLAAVERLYPPPGEVLELRTLPAAARDCTRDWTAPNSGEVAGFLREEDYLATDEMGRSLIP